MIYSDTVIFDLDGTLLNTLDDLANSTNYALSELNFPQKTREEIRMAIGNGVEQLIRKTVPFNTDEKDIQECLSIFKIHYLHNSRTFTKPYEGIIKLLETLKKKKFKIGVLSNKFDVAVKKLCNEYFYGLIDIATGESIDVPKKPSPIGLLRTINDLQSNKNRTVYIGDSEVDIETAKAAQVYSVGVLWGYRDEKTLLAAGANEIVDLPERLELIL
jgi:phosphoglycolate phosphatase